MNQKQANALLEKIDELNAADINREKRARAFYRGKKSGDWTAYDEIIKKDRQVSLGYADKISITGEH